jgi:hypothetical protein
MTTSTPMTGTLLIVADPSGADTRAQAGALAARLGHHVVLCPVELPGEPMVTGIRALVALGARTLVIVPTPEPTDRDQSDYLRAIKWASQRWPFLTFHRAAPLSWQDWAMMVKRA